MEKASNRDDSCLLCRTNCLRIVFSEEREASTVLKCTHQNRKVPCAYVSLVSTADSCAKICCDVTPAQGVMARVERFVTRDMLRSASLVYFPVKHNYDSPHTCICGTARGTMLS